MVLPLSDTRHFRKWMNDLVADQYGNNAPREEDPIELDDEPYVARRSSPPRSTTTTNRKRKAESPLDASLRHTASVVDDLLGRNRTTNSQKHSMPPPSPRLPKKHLTKSSSPRTCLQQRHLNSSSSSPRVEGSTSGVCASTHDYVPISLVHEPPPAVSSSHKRVRRVQWRREAGRRSRSRSRSRSPRRHLSPITDILADDNEFEEKLRKQIERIRAIINLHACDDEQGGGGGGGGEGGGGGGGGGAGSGGGGGGGGGGKGGRRRRRRRRRKGGRRRRRSKIFIDVNDQ